VAARPDRLVLRHRSGHRLASSANSPNGGPPVRQHVASAHGHLGLARAFVNAKI